MQKSEWMQLTNHKFITHSYSHAFPAEFALNLLREVASRREEGSVVMPSNTGQYDYTQRKEEKQMLYKEQKELTKLL